MEIRRGLTEAHASKADLGNVDSRPAQWRVLHVCHGCAAPLPEIDGMNDVNMFHGTVASVINPIRVAAFSICICCMEKHVRHLLDIGFSERFNEHVLIRKDHYGKPKRISDGRAERRFAQYFVGQSYLAPVLDAPEISIHNVTFEPGCRNNWHIHHGGASAHRRGRPRLLPDRRPGAQGTQGRRSHVHSRRHQALAWCGSGRILLPSGIHGFSRRSEHDEQRMARAGRRASVRIPRLSKAKV